MGAWQFRDPLRFNIFGLFNFGFGATRSTFKRGGVAFGSSSPLKSSEPGTTTVKIN
jgi:hypothetical protein